MGGCIRQLCWAQLVHTDCKIQKNLEGSDGGFCHIRCRHEEDQVAHCFYPDEKKLEEPKPMPPLPFPRWQAVHDDVSFRFDLVGDSIVITNWMNGCWPVNNPAYSNSVNECIDLLHDLSVRNVVPRAQHAQWIRHVLRGYNEDANTLRSSG